MKSFLLILSVLSILALSLAKEIVDSKIYRFSGAKVEKSVSGEKRLFFNGTTTHLENMKICYNDSA